MKKINLLIALLSVALGWAQSGNGNVGINTSEPTARLEIHSEGNTEAAAAFRMTYASGANKVNAFLLTDKGTFAFNQPNPTATVDLVVPRFGTSTDGWLVLGPVVADPQAVANKPDYTYIPRLETFYSWGEGSFDNNNYGGVSLMFNKLSGSNFDSTNPRLGNYIIPTSKKDNPKVGVYLSASGLFGASLDRFPTTKIDVGGSIKLEEVEVLPVKCKGGEMAYSKGHFYGCKGNNVWQLLDN
ncbi:hypothetical protein [Riemerella columbina]|uniref:hypothetical protein n=1 Tax=Riemerella columbina TaxID=103810 RepID=UPI00266F9980|nr:hypothetical protein [Riemerella columbina]WKS94916.1 hypothetical protein NYR17_08300 [Riemerella columbina]